MGRVLHGSARTTEAVCRAMQHGREGLRALAKRHGISRLPEVTGDKTPKRKFKAYPIGYFHIGIAEVHQEGGKMIAAQFLGNLVTAMPYTIHTVLTDNPVLSDCRGQAVEGGIQFTDHAHHRYAFRLRHIFGRVCDENRLEHRLTRVKPPWTKGQVE